MFRRDQLIEKLASINSGDYLTQQVLILETFVDGELSKNDIITKMANSNSQGTLGTSGIELVQFVEPTVAVHQDFSVKVGIQGTAGSGRVIWSDDLQYITGNSAAQNPWNDLILDDNTFNGFIQIALPENTNKNVALLLAQKYISTSINGIVPIGGFWGSNNVTVTYDTNSNNLFLNFKLF